MTISRATLDQPFSITAEAAFPPTSCRAFCDATARDEWWACICLSMLGWLAKPADIALKGSAAADLKATQPVALGCTEARGDSQ